MSGRSDGALGWQFMRSLRIFLLAMLVPLSGLVGSCGSTGPQYGDVREAYLLALVEGRTDEARTLLCPAAAKNYRDPESLAKDFEVIVDRYDLRTEPNSWASLRGESDRAFTTFFKNGDGEVTFMLPVRFDDRLGAQMCPEGSDVLGEVQAQG